MINTTQQSAENMLNKLAHMAQAILETAPPEIKEKISKLMKEGEKQSSTAPAADSASKDECNCLACTLRKMLVGEDKSAAASYGFKIGIAGSLPKEVVDAVGGIKTGPAADNDMDSTMRTMAAVLIEEAKSKKADSEDQKILQTSAVEHFTQGIRALNALSAGSAAVTE